MKVCAIKHSQLVLSYDDHQSDLDRLVGKLYQRIQYPSF